MGPLGWWGMDWCMAWQAWDSGGSDGDRFQGARVQVQSGAAGGVGCMVHSCLSCKECKLGVEQYCNKVVWTYNSVDFVDGSITKWGYSTIIIVDHKCVVQNSHHHHPAAACKKLYCAQTWSLNPSEDKEEIWITSSTAATGRALIYCMLGWVHIPESSDLCGRRCLRIWLQYWSAECWVRFRSFRFVRKMMPENPGALMICCTCWVGFRFMWKMDHAWESTWGVQ
jgi:hypothetical protein